MGNCISPILTGKNSPSADVQTERRAAIQTVVRKIRIENRIVTIREIEKEGSGLAAVSGHASCQRTIRANSPPKIIMIKPY